MNEINLIIGAEASKILHERPRGWEYLLLGQIINDEINLIKMADQGDFIQPIFNSKFKDISNPEELIEVIRMLDKRNTVFKSFATIDKEVSQTNEAVFGPPGKPGNPILIQSLAKRIAHSYYELIISQKEIDFDAKEYQIFSQRNFNSKSESFNIFGKTIKTINELFFEYTKMCLFTIENYQNSLKNDIQNSLKPAELKIKIDGYVINPELVTRFDLVLSAFNDYCECDEESFTTINIETDVSQNFNNLIEVAYWMLNQEQITLTALRTFLLPLSYFPGAFIDAVNERALDIIGEAALVENGAVLTINQDILRSVLESENFNF